MTGLTPEVSVLLIALGLVLALGCYLVTNLSPGGMITPGWLALVLIVQPMLAFVIGAVVVATYALCLGLQRIVILYGKRLFATVVLVAVFFQITLFLFFVNSSALFFDVTTLGFIVPGLVAYQLMRQPAVATLAATATVTLVAYSVVLAGILLRLVPIEGRAAAGGIAAEPSAAFSSLQLALSGGAMGLVVMIVGVYARGVRQAGDPSLQRRARRARSVATEPSGGQAPAPAVEEPRSVLAPSIGRPSRLFRPFRVLRSPRNALTAVLLSLALAAGVGPQVTANLSAKDAAPAQRKLEVTWLPLAWNKLDYLVLDTRVLAANRRDRKVGGARPRTRPKPGSRASAARASSTARRPPASAGLPAKVPPFAKATVPPVSAPRAPSPTSRDRPAQPDAGPAETGGGAGRSFDDSG